MSAGDDLGCGSLPENFPQRHTGNTPAQDEIVKNHTRTNRGQLVSITNEQQMRFSWQGRQKLSHQRSVDHGAFIQDEKITRERSSAMASPLTSALILQQAMQGLRLNAGAFIQSFGSASCRSGEGDFDALIPQDAEDGAEDGCLPHTGATSDDEATVFQGGSNSFLLTEREFFTRGLRRRGQCLHHVHRRIDWRLRN
jgi:hypothetical protein